MARPMKMHRVKTWNDKPAMEASTAILEPPEERDERAPPQAWRMRERMSQAMKNQ